MNYRAKPLLESLEIHASWDGFIKSQSDAIDIIWGKISDGGPYTPEKGSALRFLERDIAKMKVAILGQDPYPQPGAATGRAFEVMGLRSWEDGFRQASLKNIVRLVHHSQNAQIGGSVPGAKERRAGGLVPGAKERRASNLARGAKERRAGGLVSGASVPGVGRSEPYPETFKIIRSKIRNGVFQIAAPHELFLRWEEQGVLLLNKYLTCEVNKPGSHRAIWGPFTSNAITYISEINPAIIWMLWGEDAKSSKKDIASGIIYECRHPMMCSPKYVGDFLKSECFSATAGIIDWTGTTE